MAAKCDPSHQFVMNRKDLNRKEWRIEMEARMPELPMRTITTAPIRHPAEPRTPSPAKLIFRQLLNRRDAACRVCLVRAASHLIMTRSHHNGKSCHAPHPPFPLSP